MLVEASINIVGELNRGGSPCDFMAGESNMLDLILVDAQTNSVRAIRRLGVGPTTASAVINACAQQIDRYSSGEEVAEGIYSLMKKYTPQDMLNKTQLFKPAW
jgi:hypothetical protein